MECKIAGAPRLAGAAVAGMLIATAFKLVFTLLLPKSK